jgi:RHS repeat-associated protein
VGYELLGEASEATFDARARLRTSTVVSANPAQIETLSYAPNGEVVERQGPEGTHTYEWDSYGRLTGVTLPSGDTVSYRLDALGRRVEVTRDVGGALTTRRYLYTSGGRLAVELDEQGAVLARYVYASRPHVPDLVEKGGSTYRLVVDERGSVRAVVDVASGAVAQELEYGPFGEVLFDSAPGYQAFGFAGGLYEPATGLVHQGAREYLARHGRWLSPDPIGLAGGDTNLYAYVHGDPVGLIDPPGLQGSNPAMDSATQGGALGYAGFALIGAGFRDRGNGLAMLSNDATVEKGLGLIDRGACRIHAGGAALGAAITIAQGLGQAGTLAAGAGARLVRVNLLPRSAGGAPKALPAPRARGNPNPIGEQGTFYVDPRGNVIPTLPGGRITGSPDGRFIQARDGAGNPTGVRIDGPHRPATHSDPRAQQPHGHVPGVANSDGTPWLPINQ